MIDLVCFDFVNFVGDWIFVWEICILNVVGLRESMVFGIG